eukprot:m51a1_g7365 putative diacylglycerol o- (347) ;mRNA; f:57930-58970
MTVVQHGSALGPATLRKRPARDGSGTSFGVRDPAHERHATPTALQGALGRLAQLTLLAFWVGGYLSPALLLLLLRAHAWAAAAALAAFLAYPYVAPVRPWPAFSAWLLRAADAFEAVDFVSELGPAEVQGLRRRCVLMFAPHGVFSWGYALQGGLRPELRPLRGVVASSLYWWPVFRLFACWTGAVMPAGRRDVLAAMRAGDSFGVIPGGFEEATATEAGADKVWLRGRKGIVKYALQHGYALVPVYTFGESSTYSNAQAGMRLRLWLSSLGVPGVLPVGVWWCPLLPRPARLLTVLGQPLQLPTIERPSADDVDEWHARYVQRLREVYDRHKAAYGTPDSQLVVL